MLEIDRSSNSESNSDPNSELWLRIDQFLEHALNKTLMQMEDDLIALSKTLIQLQVRLQQDFDQNEKGYSQLGQFENDVTETLESVQNILKTEQKNLTKQLRKIARLTNKTIDYWRNRPSSRVWTRYAKLRGLITSLQLLLERDTTSQSETPRHRRLS